MKYLLLIIFVFFNIIASATDYYVSSAGNDANNGTSATTPWKTIAKINSSFSVFKPGDRILFNRGDTFYGTITITQSGSIGKPITFSSYGSGNAAIISGFSTLSSWTQAGSSNNYYATIDVPRLNIVTLNGVVKGMGRFPNTGYLNYEAHNANLSITDNQLTGTPNWTGAEICIRKYRWILDRQVVTNQSTTLLTYNALGDYGNNTYYNPVNNNGYFFQNNINCLDNLGDWYYDATAKRIYMNFGGGVPGSYVIKAGSLAKNVVVGSHNYINFTDINFEGANLSGIDLGGATNVNITNCNIYAQGGNGLYALSSSYLTITNGSITDVLNNALFFEYSVNNVTIDGLDVTNAGIIPGAARSGDKGNLGIFVAGNDFTIRNCNLTNIGYNGIDFKGNNVLVENNYVANFSTVRDDGGGIYTYSGTDVFTNRIIRNNIVYSTNGAYPGCEAYSSYEAFGKACGIYLDDGTQNVSISGNSIANCSWSGLFVHASKNCQILNNTVYNCGITGFKGQLYYEYSNTGECVGMTVTGNKFISKAANQPVYYHHASVNENPNVTSMYNNNYYVRPKDDNTTIRTELPSSGTTNRTLAGWQTYTGQDANSFKSNVSTTDTTGFFKYVYNPTTSSVTITLNAPMIDVAGTKYPGSITLLPYTSAVLMLDPNPNIEASPLYVNSVVENLTPSTIEMTYNLSLANIVPSVSAFSVLVNSASRAVNAVVISGTKVTLTLGSAVIYGDDVKVSYTKPAVNPLQTTSGGQAASISSQTVLNNVTAAIPTYVNSSIENSTPASLQMNYNLSLANIVPSVSAFSVLVNSVARTVNAVVISGTKITLTLGSAVIYGDNVKVSYTKPSANPLQTTSGGQAASISSQTVLNNVTAAIPTYVNSSIENATPASLQMNYNLSLANIVPSVSAFSVQVNSVARTVNAVVISGTKVTLTLGSVVIYGDNVKVSYTKPSANPLQTTSGGQAVSISSQTVLNNVTASIPTYVNSSIENATPSILEMNYNLSLANIVPAASAFTVMVNSLPRTVSIITISGTKVLLTMVNPVVYGDIVTIAYNKPVSNPLQTDSGVQVSTLIAQPVTNRVNAVNSFYISSVIQNTTPSLLEITYSTSLANIIPAVTAFTVQVNSVARSVNNVVISGNKVLLTLASRIVSGDNVTVAYTKPTSNPLQTTTGVQVVAIGNQSVVNNCINTAPTSVITSPVNNSSFTAESNITITANAMDADGSVSMVEFYNSTTQIGTATSAPYSFTWNNVAAGTYSLTVVATDNMNSKTKSSPVSIIVIDENQPPVVKITNPTKGRGKLKKHSTITIDAIATDPDGTISSVSFFNGSTMLAQLTSAPYSFSWKQVEPGTYSITAVATDNLNASTTSSPLEFMVEYDPVYDANSEIIKLYPNPTDGHFSIEFVNPLPNDKSEIIITDLAGKEVYQGLISKEESLKHLDLSNSKPGIYVIMIKDKKILVTKKIIIK